MLRLAAACGRSASHTALNESMSHGKLQSLVHAAFQHALRFNVSKPSTL